MGARLPATLLRIGWRNLWRNPRRTVITSLAMAIGMIMLSFVLSIMAGMQRDMIDRGTELMIGHIQIHAADYRPDRSIFDSIPGDGRQLAERILDLDSVFGASPRVGTFGLMSSGDKSLGAEILGIDRDAESQVTTLGRKLIAGDLPAAGEKTIALGRLAASTLGVELGDEIVLIAQAADGSLGNDLYRLSGIFRTGLELVDGAVAVLDLAAAQQLLALPRDKVHEIAVRTTAPAEARAVARSLASQLGAPGVEIAPWQTLAPELSSWVAMSDSWLWIMYAIVFALAAISVLNTMLMAVFERMQEFGVLAAIGMKPGAVIGMVLVEVAALAAVSLVVAAVLGAPILYAVVTRGLDLSSMTGGFSLSGVAVGPIIRGDWVVGEFAAAGALLILCAVVAGLFPATRAARADPAKLTRGELR
jgi:ABC-type lipoprotein release transport system permease subunit